MRGYVASRRQRAVRVRDALDAAEDRGVAAHLEEVAAGKAVERERRIAPVAQHDRPRPIHRRAPAAAVREDDDGKGPGAVGQEQLAREDHGLADNVARLGTVERARRGERQRVGVGAAERWRYRAGGGGEASERDRHHEEGQAPDHDSYSSISRM